MENDEYLFYKGLQKPLEFMGIRGRFIIIAAVTVVGSFLSYFLLTVFLESIIAVFVTVTFCFWRAYYYLPQTKTGIACQTPGTRFICVSQSLGTH